MADPEEAKDGAVSVTPDQQSDSGLLLFKAAERYRQVACIAAGPYIDDMHTAADLDGWISRHDPAAHLFGHAIELYLKSFLKANGAQDGGLKSNALGHNLVALLRKAKADGLSISDEAAENIEAVNEYFGLAPYRWRYPLVGTAAVFFAHGLNTVCIELRDGVFAAVVLRARLIGEQSLSSSPAK